LTRGGTYAIAYRWAMGGAAVGRLLLLFSLVPLSYIWIDRAHLNAAAGKWRAVLQWSVGRVPWATTGGQ
jgi:hypothetical protein